MSISGMYMLNSEEYVQEKIHESLDMAILRQLGRDGASLNLLVHRLNMSYNLSTEFKSIYKRLK